MTTTTTTEIICDRCGRRSKTFVRDEGFTEPPFRWMHVQYGEYIMDLCPDCKASFEEWRTKPREMADSFRTIEVEFARKFEEPNR